MNGISQLWYLKRWKISYGNLPCMTSYVWLHIKLNDIMKFVNTAEKDNIHGNYCTDIVS